MTTLGATHWDDRPTQFEAEPDYRRREREASREQLPAALAAVVTERIDWSLVEPFGYRPASAPAGA